jgi:trigger factor
MSQITVEKTAEDPASKSLRVTVPVDRVQAAEAKAIRYYAQRARLPGFRQGKAPEAVVRKRFGDAIRQSVLEEIIRESWETAKSSESLKPITDPSIRNLKFETGSPVEFDMLVEVRPEISLVRAGGFRVTRTVAAVPDSAVEDELGRLRDQKSAWIPVEGARPSPGQMVRVDVAPIEGGSPGASQPYDLVLGQNQAIPDLEERIMTLLPGESADAEVTFPDDHPDESRRGQKRKVRVTLHEVKRQELPALDDAFAREVGDFDGVEALRGAVRRDLEHQAVREADGQVRQALLNQIIEANSVPAPESLVHRMMHGYAEMYRIPEEQLRQFEQQFHPVAEAQVRRELVLDAVVEANGLRATESELDERIGRLAEARGIPAGQLYGSLQKANRLPELERSITEEKAFAFLLQQSTVEEAGT